MNEEQVRELYELLKRLSIHDDALSEIEQLVIRSGRLKAFVNILAKHLDMFETLGPEVTTLNSFEKLKDANGLYSLKFKGKNMNLRAIYEYELGYDIHILHVFDEKADSNTYDKHIRIAVERREYE